MKLGLNIGFLTSANPDPVPLAVEAERLGYDSVWAAEAWGSDAVSLIAWVGASTERIGLGTAILQIPSRTPALTAMTAATLDRLSHERLLLGLGVSGPQVVEGWHGVPYGKPLTRTREAVAIIRNVLERNEALQWDGETYRPCLARLPVVRNHGRDREAVARQLDGWLEQIPEGSSALLLDQRVPCAERTRHRNGFPRKAVNLLLFLLFEVFASEALRRTAATIVGVYLPCRGFVVEEEGVSADPDGVRLDYTERRGCCNGGVHGVAARA